MKPIVIFLGILFWVIVQIVKANRKNAARGVQNNNNSSNSVQNFADELKRFAQREIAGSSQNTIDLSNSGTNQNAAIQSSFWENERNDPNERDHFNEESLVEEYKRLHGKGKTIKHHTHNYFDEQKDRSKAIRHTNSKSQKSANRNKKVVGVLRNASKKKKKPTGIVAIPNFKDRSSVIQAIVMSEVLKRPE